MKVVIPSRQWRCYAFLSQTTEIEREPTWLVGIGDAPPVKKRVNLFQTIHAGIYGFSAVDKRDEFVRKLNNSSGKHEIAYVCSIAKND